MVVVVPEANAVEQLLLFSLQYSMCVQTEKCVGNVPRQVYIFSNKHSSLFPIYYVLKECTRNGRVGGCYASDVATMALEFTHDLEGPFDEPRRHSPLGN